MVTPYLVQPVSANQIALPTDGYRAPNDAERLLLGRTFTGDTGAQRPVPTMAPPATVPGFNGGSANASPATQTGQASSGSASPGFSFND